VAEIVAVVLVVLVGIFPGGNSFRFFFKKIEVNRNINSGFFFKNIEENENTINSDPQDPTINCLNTELCEVPWKGKSKTITWGQTIDTFHGIFAVLSIVILHFCNLYFGVHAVNNKNDAKKSYGIVLITFSIVGILNLVAFLVLSKILSSTDEGGNLHANCNNSIVYGCEMAAFYIPFIFSIFSSWARNRYISFFGNCTVDENI